MAFSSVESSLAELSRQLDEGAVAACPAPRGSALALCQQQWTDYMVYWSSPDEPATWVGFGAESQIRSRGPARFEQTRQALQTVASTLRPAANADPVSRGWAPRFFGGAAFSVGRDGSGCWETFGDATFVLPKVCYVDGPEGAFLMVCRLDSSRQELLELAGKVLERALNPPPLTAQGTPSTRWRIDSQNLETWSDLVQAVQSSIDSGSFEKIVTARRITLCLSETPSLSKVLFRLSQQAPRCVRFAMRIGTRIFVGATPEHLIIKRGACFQTEALAGTIGRRKAVDERGRAAPEQLLASRKDRAEHRFVVEAIRGCLSPLCSRLDIPEQPTVANFKELYHLCTPIEGQLKENRHVLDLAGRLHPTPAVGGVPQKEAQTWIAEHEHAERGWYAAPFGWCNAHGDGTFMVALRSALLHENKVHLYAGAGIVRDSDPVLEYEETELKLQGMLVALGVRELQGAGDILTREARD